MKKKFKVLLLNVPAAALNLNRFRERCQHIPLACGYLKAYAYAAGLASDVRIDIAPQSLMNLGGDSALISYILEGNYDLAGFTLYQWNALRSLHIMREAKKRNSRIRFLAGGPEVSPGTEYMMEEKALDFMITGEGEEPFRKLLLVLLEKGHHLDEIPGLIYRGKNGPLCNARPEALKDVTCIPSPYLLGYFDMESHGGILLETMRGCIFNCRYCSWKHGGRKGVSLFPAERIRQEIILCREKGIRHVRLVDAGTNVNKKWLKNLCKVMSSENRDRFIEFHTYLHPELIDEESAAWLREANFKNPIIGLQSTNPEALKAMGRDANQEAYLRGTALLREHKVNYISTIILGLPGDTEKGFEKTLDFLLENDQKRVICFPLSVAPNTHFRFEAQSFGLQFQKMPPNLIISTPTMDFDSLKRCIRLFREQFCQRPGQGVFEKDIHLSRKEHYPVNHYLHNRYIPYLSTHVQGRYPLPGGKKSSFRPLPEVLSRACHDPLTRIIFSRESRSADERIIDEMAGHLAPRLSWNTLLWLKDVDSGHDMTFLKRFLSSVSRQNSFHIWHIVLEFQKEIPLDVLSGIRTSVISRPGTLEYESLYEQDKPRKEHLKISPIIYAVVPCGTQVFSVEWTARLSKKLPLFWKLTLPHIITEFPNFGVAFLADFFPDTVPSQILYTLNAMINCGEDRPFFFTNWVLQRLWLLYRKGDMRKWDAEEHVLDIVDKERTRLSSFTHSLLRKHLLTWIKGQQ
jgi:radical SAM superfamily enzyme YgiQ (UPF0313 family)